MTRTLHDADTNDEIGEATPAQTAASDAAGPDGYIWIDGDGDPIDAQEASSIRSGRYQTSGVTALLSARLVYVDA